MIARQSASLLRAAGHAEWIACNERDYVALAARVAETVRRGEIRAELAADFPQSKLCDVATFTATLERAWIALVERGPRNGTPAEPPLEIPG